MDPRQALATAYYSDPNSDSFGIVSRSLARAGYDKKYSVTTTLDRLKWLSPILEQNVKMVKQAETNLKKYLEIEIDMDNKNSIDLARLKVDVSKFILKTLARKKYSEKQEDTPANIQVNIVNYNDAPVDTKARVLPNEDKPST